MSDYCTIYCVELDYEKVLQILSGIVSLEALEVIGQEHLWRQIIIRGDENTLTFNSKHRQNPGDSFSRLILATHNHFRTKQADDGESKSAILKHLLSCNFAIGVVAEPRFSEAEKHYDCIYGVARSLNGMIFNGSAMIDADGREM